MLVRKLLFVVAVAGILGMTGKAFAEGEGETAKPKSLIERLDAFGKSLFGGFLPAKKPIPKPSETSESSASLQRLESPRNSGFAQKPESPEKDPRIVTRGSMLPAPSEEEPVAPRAGSVLAKPQLLPPARNDDPTLSMDEFMPENTPPPTARPQVIERGMMEQQPAEQKAVKRQPAERKTVEPQPVERQRVERQPVERQPVARQLVESAVEIPRPVTPPLHERMASLRKSPFDSDENGDANGRVSTQPDQASDTVAENEEGISDPDSPNRENRPLVAQRVVPAAPAGATRPAEPIYDTESDRPTAVKGQPGAAGKSPSRGKPDGDATLFARKSPILSVETLGPRAIIVGRESTYQVNLTNSGEVAADGLVVHVTLPAWADVIGMEASVGEARPIATSAGTVDWKVGHLDAKSRQRLALRIIPRQSRPFDLAVRWDFKPATSLAMIEVQEPKLSLKLEGPHDVIYGKKELYRLKLANKGSAKAENIVIVLTPIGTGDNVSASHKIGLLAPGEEKSLDVELTARQGGLLTIQAEARADAGLHAELIEKVLVRRAGLKLDIVGPKSQYVGSAATYSIRVRSSGTAPAQNVNLAVALPAGAAYISGISNARFNPAESKLMWNVETLAPDVERTFTIKCRLATVGTAPVRLSAVADHDVVASAEMNIQVETVANLTMDVKDPTEPVPVGEETVYEVRVRNRGTKEAQNVEVFAYFSRGVEPTAAEGAPNRVAAGQVVFQPIASLAPGAVAVLKVRAKADVAGNHIFRAEARCRPLNARLIREATTLYYIDAPLPAQTSQEPSASSAQAPAENESRRTPRPVQGSRAPLLPRG